ncbi:MAG TPA: fasciclin domain-containing protein [Streptosporangiaceae bacterium]|nr:fasciclin domain-containing protein [Streptosporangiaceae bacterium]
MSASRNLRKAPGALTPGAVASVLALVAAGCGSSGSSVSQHAMAPHHHMPSHSESMTHSTAAFGADCSMVPASGMGSFHTMSMEPVVTAASHNPLLTGFAAAARRAGLTAQLDSLRGITVFAPENSAFTKVSGSAMTMLEHSASLAEILRYHVVSGHETAADLARGMALKTLEGSTVRPSKMGAVYEVNNAHVICGNIQTANATVYIIDTVLMPMHMH